MWITRIFVTQSRYPHVNNLCLTKYHLYTVSTIVLLNIAVELRTWLRFPRGST
jgi:hypothetical protein